MSQQQAAGWPSRPALSDNTRAAGSRSDKRPHHTRTFSRDRPEGRDSHRPLPRRLPDEPQLVDTNHTVRPRSCRRNRQPSFCHTPQSSTRKIRSVFYFLCRNSMGDLPQPSACNRRRFVVYGGQGRLDDGSTIPQKWVALIFNRQMKRNGNRAYGAICTKSPPAFPVQ